MQLCDSPPANLLDLLITMMYFILKRSTWLVSLACRKAKELGYPHELWTTRLLARHAREHGPAEGHACLANLAQGTVCKILDQEEVKPHKVRYYLEQRDPDFAEKMAEVLCVYRQVRILKRAAAVSKKKPSDAMAIISYDEKPGIQAIATTAPDLPPEPGVHGWNGRNGLLISPFILENKEGPRTPGPFAKRLCDAGLADILPVPSAAGSQRDS